MARNQMDKQPLGATLTHAARLQNKPKRRLTTNATFGNNRNWTSKLISFLKYNRLGHTTTLGTVAHMPSDNGQRRTTDAVATERIRRTVGTDRRRNVVLYTPIARRDGGVTYVSVR